MTAAHCSQENGPTRGRKSDCGRKLAAAGLCSELTGIAIQKSQKDCRSSARCVGFASYRETVSCAGRRSYSRPSHAGDFRIGFASREDLPGRERVLDGIKYGEFAPITSPMGLAMLLARIQTDASRVKTCVNEDLSGLDAPKHRKFYSSSWAVSARSLQLGEGV